MGRPKSAFSVAFLRVICLLVAVAIFGGSAVAQDATEKPAKADGEKQRKKEQYKKEADKQTQQKKEKEPKKKVVGQQEQAEKPLAADAKNSVAKNPAVAAEREAAALAFVREHHPELADLVAALKTQHPKEYQRALRDLVKANDGLAQLRQRDLQKYDLDLQAWKLRSRIELLAVRLKMNAGDESLRGELKQLLSEQFVVQQSLLKLDRERAQTRVDQIDKKLKQIGGNADQYVEKQLQSLLQEKKPGKPVKNAE